MGPLERLSVVQYTKRKRFHSFKINYTIYINYTMCMSNINGEEDWLRIRISDFGVSSFWLDRSSKVGEPWKNPIGHRMILQTSVLCIKSFHVVANMRFFQLFFFFFFFFFFFSNFSTK